MSDLPAGWEWTTIGKVADIQLGRQRSPKNHLGPHMRPYLRSANVTWGGIDLSDVKEMNFEPSEAATFELQPGDLLLNEASGSPNEVGKPAIWKGGLAGCCFQNTLLRVRSKGPATAYLYWYCRSAVLAGDFGRAGRGVNIRHLGKQGLARFPLPLPPEGEQERIVAAIEEHLSRLDAAVANTARAIERVRCLGTQIIDAAMFLAGESATLDSYAAPGGITDGPFGSKLKSSDYTSEGPRVVRLENIGVGDFIDEQTHISTEYFEELRKHEAVGGDIVVASLVSERLRACIVPMDLGPAIVKADCIRVRLSHGTDSRFVKYALMRSLLDDFVAENVRGVGRSRLGLTNVRRIPVPLADPDVQRRIADGLDEKLAVLACVKSQGDEALRRATALRRSVLAAAFSGQLVLQDPGDEPASVLLERIRDQPAATTPTRRTRTKAASQ